MKNQLVGYFRTLLPIIRYWPAKIIWRRCASVPRDTGAFEAVHAGIGCRIGCKSLQA